MARGQAVPWTVIPTSVSQTIRLDKVDSSVSYNMSFNTIGDAIGVFYNQSGTYVCGGYLQLDGVTDVFTVYGNDAVDNGFQFNESFHFMFWRKEQNCIIDNPFGAMINAQYTTGLEDTLIIIGAMPASVSYPENWYCRFNTGVLPIPMTITGTTFANLVITPVAPVPDGFDPGTGNFETFGNTASGVYRLDLSTLDNMCLADTFIVIAIDENLNSNPSITTTDLSCTIPLGTIDLDTSTIDIGTTPLAFQLTALTTNSTLNNTSGLFSNLDADNYQLIIKDLHGCADSINVTVNPNLQNCESKSFIITPLMANEHSTALLDWEGETTIYNAQGELIKTLTAPTSWDGTNKHGEVVKTGAYFIFNKDRKKLEVTVIY